MTQAIAPRPPAGTRLITHGVAERVRNVVSMTRRNLVHSPGSRCNCLTSRSSRLFTVLFIYLFGSAIPIPGGSYTDFILAGPLALNLTTSTWARRSVWPPTCTRG